MVRAYRSAIIHAPIKAVWSFAISTRCRNGTRRSRAAREEGRAGDSIGCIRNFDLKEGGNLREQLLSL
jgi:hypothetical protein